MQDASSSVGRSAEFEIQGVAVRVSLETAINFNFRIFFFAEKRYFIFELKNTVFRKKFPWQDSKLKKYRTGVLDFRYFFILKIGNYF